jgi:hypothetical protein
MTTNSKYQPFSFFLLSTIVLQIKSFYHITLLEERKRKKKRVFFPLFLGLFGGIPVKMRRIKKEKGKEVTISGSK